MSETLTQLELLTVVEAAELLKRHPSTVYRRLESGEWEAFSWKDGKDWRIEKTPMLEYLRSRPVRTRRPVEDPMPPIKGGRDRFRAILAQKREAAA